MQHRLREKNPPIMFAMITILCVWVKQITRFFSPCIFQMLCIEQRNPFCVIERTALSPTSFLSTRISFYVSILMLFAEHVSSSEEHKRNFTLLRPCWIQSPLLFQRNEFCMSSVDNKLYANNLNINYKYIWPKKQRITLFSLLVFLSPVFSLLLFSMRLCLLPEPLFSAENHSKYVFV